MAEGTNVRKQHLDLHTQLHSLSVQFNKGAVQIPSSFPPVYIRMTRGSHSADSSRVHLIASTISPGKYTATWTEATLSMTLTVSRDVESGRFVSRDVKYQLKIYSEGKTSHKTLASCTFDVTSLKLETANCLSTKKQQLQFLAGKNAATAITDIVLEATFQYEILPHQPTFSPESSTVSASPPSSICSSPSPPPTQPSTSPLPPSSTSPQSSTSVILKLPPPPQHLPPTPPQSKQFPQQAHHSGGSKAYLKLTETPPSAEKLQPSTTTTPTRDKDNDALKEIVLRKGTNEATETDGGQVIKAPPLSSPDPIVKGKPPKPPRSAKTKRFKNIFKVKGRKGRSKNQKMLDPEGLQGVETPVSEAPSLLQHSSIQGLSQPPSTADLLSKGTRLVESGDTVTRPCVPSPELEPPRRNGGDTQSKTVRRHTNEKQIEENSVQGLDSTSHRIPGYHHTNAESTSPIGSMGTVSCPPKSPTGSFEATHAALLEGHTAMERRSTGESGIHKQAVSQIKAWPQEESRPRRYSAPSAPKETTNRHQNRSNSEITYISQPKNDVSQISSSKNEGSGRTNASPAKVHQLQTDVRLHPSADSVVCPPSTSVKSKPKHAPTQKPRLNKILSGSTPILTNPSLARDDKSSSTSDLSHQYLPREMGARRISIGDLLQPVRSSAVESMIQKRRQSVAAVPDLLGILKMKLSAVNIADNTPGPRRSLVDIVFEPESSNDLVNPVQTPSEGLFCVFTINAGNSRAETSVQPIVPRRPVVWDESEEILFYANQSRQVFILCRKTVLDEAKVHQNIFPATSGASNVVGVRRMSQLHDDTCIGATVLPISQVRVSSTSMDAWSANLLQCLQRQQYETLSLPMQPKGMLLLETYFYALQPQFKVSCKGTVTLRSLSGLISNPVHDLSCTVKIDSEFQDSTSVLASEECAREGWDDEPVEFSAYQNLNCDIQVWAYSSEQTEYWCGGCTVPLAMVLPEEDAKKHTEISRGNNIQAFVVSTPCEKTITMPIEPKGLLTLSFALCPSPRSRQQSPDLASPSPEVPADSISESSSRTFKQGSLRRNLSTTLRNTGDFGLKIRKSYNEEPFILQQENTDLKREVEYLREELRQTKAKLAESEFYRQKALLDLRKSSAK